MRDQTVGSNSREGGAWPGKQGKLGIAIDWVTSRSTLESFSEWAQCTVRPTQASSTSTGECGSL